MGQYHMIVNLDKKEYLDPHNFDEGIKLMEFGSDGCGVLRALAVLLSNSPNRGGGDLHSDDTEYYGRWAADRIVIAGDYAKSTDKGEDTDPSIENLFCRVHTNDFRDISWYIQRVIKEAGED